MTTPTAATHTNRLAAEKSPYLLQHQHNPVDWFPWGPEAFAKARGENKPIFLSIGYSTCHWCHVMERETFEDEAVARFLNAHFVSIKVDREERPDVDQIYMTFVQATTGSGGWPLNVFLTPDRKPFYGGTYFPPSGRGGRPGFLDLLHQVQHLWSERPGELVASAVEVHRQLEGLAQKAAADRGPLTMATLDRAASILMAEYDPANGGFGGSPKFPRPSQPAFLLRWARRTGDAEVQRLVLHTCDRMAAGGLHDQLGGGFARYSVDAEWLVPHFEKMLYDNAQLAQLYLDAHLLSGEARHAAVLRDILDYILRDMTSPEGGFYSAEDADSEGKEGKFYCWTQAEFRAVLTPEEFAVASRYFGVTADGNFVDHSDPDPLPDQNVLHVADPHLAPHEVPRLEAAKNKLFAVRSKRVRPHLDDKILSSWNGLMLGVLARAGVVLGESRYLDAARRNFEFIRRRLWDATTRTLYHRWRDGERDTVQLLDAYAFQLAGALDLYEATLDPAVLQFALDMAGTLLGQFEDADQGGFWQSATGADDLILRVKEDYDGALPAGNSVAILALFRLADITDQNEFRVAADKGLRHLAGRLVRQPQAVPALLSALDYSLGDVRRVVIAGEAGEAGGRELLAAALRVYRPNRVVLGTRGPVDPFARTLPAREGRATAYVCTGQACEAPTSNPEELNRLLQ